MKVVLHYEPIRFSTFEGKDLLILFDYINEKTFSESNLQFILSVF
jgi:hypothetical protein